MQQAVLALNAVQKALDFALADLGTDPESRWQRYPPRCSTNTNWRGLRLALSCAEVTGARFMLDYAERARPGGGSTSEVLSHRASGKLFTAEALQGVRKPFERSPGRFRPERQLAERHRDHPGAGFWWATAGGHARRLGAAGTQPDGVTGAYLLDDHHEMMRDTFRRVAEEVVMLLAEEIHRHDLDIPDTILDQVPGNGLLLAFPFQSAWRHSSDEHEDNLGMIVVTEELTRGSLGAAGSPITRPEILSKALLKGGTEEQKENGCRNWHPAICRARWR